MALHTEIHLECDICAHLASHGWLYTEPGAEGDSRSYDTPRALYPADVVAWLQATQPKAWATITRNHGTAAEGVLLDRLRKALDTQGTLDMLRHGFDMLGLKAPLRMAQFRPALGMNPALQAAYDANRLRVLRQVRTNHDDVIDLVLLLNGIPVATAEIKTDFTQDVNRAIDQYRFDRLPRPKGRAGAEPLLDFPRGALVHFAVSNRLVHMTTRLLGPATQFLPFNLGSQGGAGNPPARGHRTHYLWEQVWQRDSWLEIIERYLVTRRDSKKRIEAVIFPRYHQLDATRRLVQSVLADGPGGKYLIQHSAGSGKTNSIAWTAHFLSDLHDAQHDKLFSTVLVVSDRNVLDAQLREAIFDFQRTTGVVETITGQDASKSRQLAAALSGSKKIIVCTIQTFPFALDKAQELAATQGKRFAVIADEAHSSQTGASAAKLKQLLSTEELQDLADGGEVSNEDIILAAQMGARAGGNAGITYIAFTATPKAKTLELFGRRPNPSEPASETNLPQPFHVYSMRQAIEEGFILDVLKNYTPYKLAFRLTHGGKDWTETEVDQGDAVKHLMRWVRLHPYNISQKVAIVVEHFIDNVQPLLGGRAKAMVVTASRIEAVRWKRAIDQYIAEHRYDIGTLVAFSGEVTDAESAPEPVTEKSAGLNPGLAGKDIREAFATEAFQILLVANKFQTGFDQPLLCGMYVDKRLAGIQAVQTLSRLNRAYNGPHGLKDTTYVLDFVNDPDEVLAAFQTYYETAELSGVTDPNLVYELRAKLDASGHYDEFEVERVVRAELNPSGTQAALVAAIEPVADRLLKQFKAARARLDAAQPDGPEAQAAKDDLDALQLFKRDLGTYVRVYAFLSQLFNYGNTDIEKRAIFFKRLLPLLDFGRERDGIDTSQVVLTHHKLKDQGQRHLALHEAGAEYKLDPMAAPGSGQLQDKQKALLSEILARLNDLFEGELSDGDQLSYVHTLKSKLDESEVLVQQAKNNAKPQFEASPDLDTELENAIIDAFEKHQVMSRQALNSPVVRAGLKAILLGPAGLYEGLRGRG